MDDARPRILIIEDNPDLLSILEQVLQREYAVRTARRGEEGVTLATSLQPDVVILDLQLPNMNGIEAGRWIKREVPHVRILVLTGLASKTDEEAVLTSGCCDAYLAKPASLESIRNAVAELLVSGTRTSG